MIMSHSKKIKILATLGPSTLDKEKLSQLEGEGVDLFRINLSHTPLAELESVLRFVQDNTSTPVCIDSEGAQLRTGNIKGGEIILQDNERIVMGEAEGEENIFTLPFNFNEVLKEIKVGETLHVGFDSVVIEIVERRNERVLIGQVLSGGKVGSNKGVHASTTEFPLPPLTKKDVEAVRIARVNGIVHFALSFANSASDVQQMREHIGKNSFLISKIESNGGLRNLNDICANSSAILIDRGDLSRAQSLEKIPFLQKKIVAVAKELEKEVYVATNLLESMTQKKEPTRAEVSDVAGALLEGVDGLVLAAETAIGKYPVACVKMIRKIIGQWQIYRVEKHS